MPLRATAAAGMSKMHFSAGDDAWPRRRRGTRAVKTLSGDGSSWIQQSLDCQRRRGCPAPTAKKKKKKAGSISGSPADCGRHTGSSNDRQQLSESAPNHCQSSLSGLNLSCARIWAQCYYFTLHQSWWLGTDSE